MTFNYQHTESTITISIKALTGAGVPDTGRTVSVNIEDAKDGTSILSSQALTENGTTGIYTFDWTHGFTVKKLLYFHINVAGGGPPENIIVDVTLDDRDEQIAILLEDIDEREGNAI